MSCVPPTSLPPQQSTAAAMGHGKLYGFIGATALITLLLTDLTISRTDPWLVLEKIFLGAIQPDLSLITEGHIWQALMTTVTISLWGTAIGMLGGAMLALVFQFRLLRWLSTSLRSIHELIWALLLMPLMGTGSLTGVVAIAIPSVGIFAKIFSEIHQEADPRPARGLPSASDALSRWCYGILPSIYQDCKQYVSYRFECGLRASAILGFVGIHTIGFDLESYISDSHWSQAATLIYLFIFVVAGLRWGLRWWSSLVLWLGASWWLNWTATWNRLSIDNALRYLHECVPWPLRRPDPDATWASRLGDTSDWLGTIFIQQMVPGLWNTLILGTLSAALAALLSPVLSMLACRHIGGPIGSRIGHLFFIGIRTLPAYLITFVLLICCGASMLPAVLALTVHNIAILAHLGGHSADQIRLPTDRPRRVLDRFCYYLLPRMSGSQLAFAFYRYEVILRESVILGIIGIATIGFHIDTAIQEHKPDEAILFVACTAALLIVVDSASQWLRHRCRLVMTHQKCT